MFLLQKARINELVENINIIVLCIDRNSELFDIESILIVVC